MKILPTSSRLHTIKLFDLITFGVFEVERRLEGLLINTFAYHNSIRICYAYFMLCIF